MLFYDFPRGAISCGVCVRVSDAIWQAGVDIVEDSIDDGDGRAFLLRMRYGDAAGTSNLTNVRLTRQKSALFQ
jgi:hypothetical protein